MTNREGCQISIIVGIVYFTKEWYETKAFAKAFGQLSACTCRRPHIVSIQNGQFITLGTIHLIILTVNLSTYHSITAVFANLQIIGGNGVPHPSHPVLLFTFNGTIGTHHLTIGNRIGEETLLFLCVIHTQSGANHKVLKWSNAQMHITKHTPLGILIVLCIGNHAQWILALRVGTKSLSILAVFCIDGEVGVKLQSVLQHTTRSINTLRTVDGEVLT